MNKDKQIIMYKKECCNEPYCSFNQVLEQLNQLKAENERLKQAFAESDNDCFRLEKENNLLKVYRSITPLKVKKLVKALSDIKKIAESVTYGGSKCINCGEEAKNCADCMVEIIEQILQKISEVEDESNI